MTIQYYLTKLSDDMNPQATYIGRTVSGSTMDLDDLVDAVTARKTALGRGDVAGVLDTLCDVIESELLRGNRVQLGRIARLWTTMKGTFDSKSAPYDPETHSVRVACSARGQLQRVVGKKAQVRRISPAVHVPQLCAYRNVSDGSDTMISSHSVCQLAGDDLNFDADDATQGLFIVDAVGTLPDVKVSTLANATAKQIVFQTPAIDGYSRVELQVRRRQTHDGNILTGTYTALNVTTQMAALGV